MTVVPKFDLPAGSKVTILNTEMVVTGTSDGGYELCAVGSGAASFIPFIDFVDYLKLPGVKIDATLPETGNRLQIRLGGIRTSKNLPASQQEVGAFHLSLCHGMGLLRQNLRLETGNNNLELSIRMLDRPEYRKFIQSISQILFGKVILVGGGHGGKRTNWVMYKGRTLVRYMKMFDALHPQEDPLDALVSLDHLKGNRDARVSDQAKRLMTQAWEQAGLDTKTPAVSDVMKHLELLIHEENALRKRNDLPALLLPSASTLRSHRDHLLSPTEYMVATRGPRFSRNKRGRGRTLLHKSADGQTSPFP